MMRELAPNVRAWLAEPMPSAVARSVASIAARPEVARVAVMPDVHLAREVCVGLVVAAPEHVFPAAVGGDIGCGMLAAAFDVGADAIDALTAQRVLAALADAVPIRRHRVRSAPSLATYGVDDCSADDRFHLGTLGTGNHFVELQAEPDGRLWAMIHSGSRGVGRTVARAHRIERGLVAVVADAPEGHRYVDDAARAVRFAAANRRAMLDAVACVLAEVVGARLDTDTVVDCTHNFVRREAHDGADYWVHRKGALPADRDAPGMIPGSMGTRSFHVTGRGEPAALRSASHGAGRVGSRADARRTIPVTSFRRSMRGVAYDPRRERQLIEEAPDAYKDIARVMRAQRDLVRITRELRPVLVYKGT